MSDTPESAVDALLERLPENGDAAEELLPLVYAELRALAGAYFRDQRPGHTLQPTALVHDAFVRLVGNRDLAFQGQAHFFAVAAKAMRHVLADHARRKNALKRGGDAQRVTLAGIVGDSEDGGFDAADIDAALTDLAGLSPRQARVVELRFFGGLSIEHVASLLGVSRRTVDADWRMARAWLRGALRERKGDADEDGA